MNHIGRRCVCDDIQCINALPETAVRSIDELCHFYSFAGFNRVMMIDGEYSDEH
jgi:hypothetical protein